MANARRGQVSNLPPTTNHGNSSPLHPITFVHTPYPLHTNTPLQKAIRRLTRWKRFQLSLIFANLQAQSSTMKLKLQTKIPCSDTFTAIIF